MTDKTVRVSIPASVAGNIDGLKKAVGGVLDHLGCQACCSGHDILFELQRDVVFAKNLRGGGQPSALGRAAVGHFAAAKTDRVVRVGINPEVAGKIDNVFEAIDKIAELTGHVACATGCDMFFNLERTLVLDARAGIEEQALTLG